MEKMGLERIILQGTILSPIHIGDGTDIEPLDYVISDDLLYRIDLGTFISALPPTEEKNISFVRGGSPGRDQLIDIRRFIKDRFSTHMPFMWRARVSQTVRKLYEEKLDQPENLLLLCPFIRSGDHPYIPGSSLKGVIRTALLNKWAEEIRSLKVPGKPKEVEAEILKALDIKPSRKADQREQYKQNIDKEIFRAIRVEDVSLPDGSTCFMKVSNYNLKEGRLNETNIQMIREVTESALSEGRSPSISFTISIDHRYLKHPGSALGRRDMDVKTILSSCNEFYRRVLDDERKRLFDGKSEDIAAIYNKISEESDGLFLLRIGWGSGVDAMTIKKFMDPNIRWGKSKHIVEGKYPLGWIAVSHGEK